MPKIFTSSDSDLNSIKYDHSVVQNSSQRGNEVKMEGRDLYLSNLTTGLDFTTFFSPLRGPKETYMLIWN